MLKQFNYNRTFKTAKVDKKFIDNHTRLNKCRLKVNAGKMIINYEDKVYDIFNVFFTFFSLTSFHLSEIIFLKNFLMLFLEVLMSKIS